MANFFKKTLDFIGLGDEDDNIDIEPMEDVEEKSTTCLHTA